MSGLRIWSFAFDGKRNDAHRPGRQKWFLGKRKRVAPSGCQTRRADYVIGSDSNFIERTPNPASEPAGGELMRLGFDPISVARSAAVLRRSMCWLPVRTYDILRPPTTAGSHWLRNEAGEHYDDDSGQTGQPGLWCRTRWHCHPTRVYSRRTG